MRASASSAAAAANTTPSSSEFEASRFAPWRPVQVTSPAANRFATSVSPRRSVTTPPQQ